MQRDWTTELDSEAESLAEYTQNTKFPRPPPDNIDPSLRRSSRVMRALGSWWWTNLAAQLLRSVLIASNVPSSAYNAVEGPHFESWVPGVQSELDAHDKMEHVS